MRYYYQPRKGPAFSGLRLLRAAAKRMDPSLPSKLPHEEEAELCRVLDAAVGMAIVALRVGSPVEVFWRPGASNRFWAARVVALEAEAFEYVFDDSDERGGRVRFCDFLTRWRFPMGLGSEHFTIENAERLLRHRATKRRAYADVVADRSTTGT